MRLTLRTLLAYLDDTLEPAQAKVIGQKVAESDTAQELIARIKQVTRRRRLTTPPESGPGARLDANTIAEYLDNTLDADQLAEVEQICLASDVHLAEMAACHQILTLVFGEPILVPPTAKQRMYGVVKGREAIPFRKPPAAARADADEGPAEGKEVDETLRLGLPALRRKDGWRNRLILIGGALALVACLVVAILRLLPSPAEDDTGGAHAKVNLKKKDEDKPGKQKDDGAKKKEEKPPIKAKKDGKEDDGQKGAKDGDKKIEPDDGQKEKIPVPPTKKDEVPQGPPSDKAEEIARFEPPSPPVPVLLQYDPAKSLWHRLERGTKPARIWTARPLVSLPGFRSNVLTDSGVRLTLAGTMPEFFPGVPVFESLVTLHAHDQLDLDLTLHRGRILLTNTKTDKPLQVRVRFENTTDPAQKEMWDLKLEGKDTEVLFDRFSPFDDEPFYEDPKHPDRKGPLTQVGLIVLRGTATVRLGDVTYALTEPPGPALMGWNSRTGPRGPDRLQKLFEWTAPNPPAPKGGEDARTDMRRATGILNTNISGSGVEQGLRKSLNSAETGVRKLAVRCYAALDMVPQLLDALENKERPDVRATAIEALRHWLTSSRDNDYKLLAELKQGRYTKIESERIVARLHYLPGATLRQPETYGTLIDELQSKRLPIRELAAWHLYQLVPEARKTIHWDATAPPEGLAQIYGLWRQLSRSWPGGIPPRFSKGAPMK